MLTTPRMETIKDSRGATKGAILFTKADRIDFSSFEVVTLKELGRELDVPVFSARLKDGDYSVMAENDEAKQYLRGAVSRHTPGQIKELSNRVIQGEKYGYVDRYKVDQGGRHASNSI